MKRILVLILSFIMGIFGLTSCAELLPIDEINSMRTIAYYAVIDGTKTSVPAGMYKKDGNYPTRYEETVGASVDDLQDYTEGETTYTFGGWFTDEACSTAFTGIDKNSRGNVTLYAKVTKTVEPAAPEYATIEYWYVVDDEEPQIGFLSLLLGEDKSKYPSQYEVGVGATIGDLESEKTEGNKTYTFEGWYTDSACKTKFTGIGTTETGKVTVYAKITSKETETGDGAFWTKNY